MRCLSTVGMQFLNFTQGHYVGSSSASPTALQSDGGNFQQRLSTHPTLSDSWM